MVLEFTKYVAVRVESKSLGGISIISFISYVSIIVFGFVTLTSRIKEKTGRTTSDLQTASSRDMADNIIYDLLAAADDVYLLYFLDYLFIIAGFILFVSLNSLLLQSFEDQWYEYLPRTGILLTIISRTLDGLENLWVVLMISNANNYPTYLITLVNITESLKWFVVYVEYSVLGLGIIFYVIFRSNSKKSEM